MWNKGAVVIVKHGDRDMANAIQDGMALQVVPSKDVEELKRAYDLLKQRDSKYWARKVRRARKKYATYYEPLPSWAKPFVDLWALFLYGYATFVDKFMTIK